MDVDARMVLFTRVFKDYEKRYGKKSFCQLHQVFKKLLFYGDADAIGANRFGGIAECIGYSLVFFESLYGYFEDEEPELMDCSEYNA